ncbi:MAG: cyclic nucleotide-binding domain-containing protein [Planctomycetota bacterium]|jgi:CRP-like cAMP-binding protein/Fe-S-cluster-containing dehydrogenase component|nr:cyclic nucleotide-binding domain-containing protein [Planctomycetota bacterium]
MSDEMVTLTIDEKEVSVPPGTTIYDAARENDIDIPVVCHMPDLEPVAACRMCVVDAGARTFPAACIRECEKGMEVKTNTPEVAKARKVLTELLMTDYPEVEESDQHLADFEIENLSKREGVAPGHTRFPVKEEERSTDNSSSVIKVDHNACILCDRCVRACTDVKGNLVIGRNGKGFLAQIGFDNDLPMGQSSCVSCGECLVSCPTSALTINDGGFTVGDAFKESGDPVVADELLDISIFQGISPAFLQRNLEACVRRTFKKGEIICREGEFGNTAFYVIDGTVEVYISTPVERQTKKTQLSGLFGLVNRMASGLSKREKHQEDPESMGFIPIDAPIDLDKQNPVAQMTKGDLFGEQSAMNFYPRSATVRASEDCVLLEMLRPVLQILQKNPAFKEEMEEKYRERALSNQLRGMPIFKSLTPEFIDELREKVELIRYEPGETVFSEGDPADALYIVRLGFVQVMKSFPGGDLTLAYLHKGTYFGEMGLLGEMVRTATCRALDHVELVKVSAVDFRIMLERFPEVEASFRREVEDREEQNRAIAEAGMVGDQNMTDFLDQGLMKAQSLLLLDLDKCVRCDECVRACADAHQGVTRLVRDGLRFDRYLVATACRSCTDPLCMVGCPVGSIRRRNSLEIIIEDWCVGCGLCADQCPYGNINLHPFEAREEDPEHPGRKRVVVRNKATGCDLCSDIGSPSCVYACPHDAARRVNGQQFFEKHYLGVKSSEGREN